MDHFVYIMTSAPIVAGFDAYDIYDVYDRVAQGIAVASLAPNASLFLATQEFPFSLREIREIYTANKGQTVETAKIIQTMIGAPGVLIVPTPLLDGVRFSMSQCIVKERFVSMPYSLAIVEARRKFVEQFYDDQLLEPRASIMTRIERLCARAKEQSAPTLYIGHSFFMRLVQVFLSDPACFDHREKLLRAFNPDKKPFEPLTGFRLA